MSFTRRLGALLFEILFILILRQYLFHLRIPIIPQAHHLFAHLPTIQIGLFSFRFHLISELSFHFTEICRLFLIQFQSDADTEGVKQELASGTIVNFWKGDTALIRKTIEKGYDVVNSYHEYTYLDYSYESIPMEKAYSFNPVPEGLTDDQKSKVLGLGCQMWGEFIPTVESMNLKVYPRLAAYAETGWTDASNKDYQRFLDKLNSFLQKWKTEGITCGPVQ